MASPSVCVAAAAVLLFATGSFAGGGDKGSCVDVHGTWYECADVWEHRCRSYNKIQIDQHNCNLNTTTFERDFEIHSSGSINATHILMDKSVKAKIGEVSTGEILWYEAGYPNVSVAKWTRDKPTE